MTFHTKIKIAWAIAGTVAALLAIGVHWKSGITAWRDDILPLFGIKSVSRGSSDPLLVPAPSKPGADKPETNKDAEPAQPRGTLPKAIEPARHTVLSTGQSSWFPNGSKTTMEIGISEVALDPNRHTLVSVQQGKIFVRRQGGQVSSYASTEPGAPHSTTGFGILSVAASSGRAIVNIEVETGPPLYQGDYQLDRLR